MSINQICMTTTGTASNSVCPIMMARGIPISSQCWSWSSSFGFFLWDCSALKPDMREKFRSIRKLPEERNSRVQGKYSISRLIQQNSGESNYESLPRTDDFRKGGNLGLAWKFPIRHFETVISKIQRGREQFECCTRVPKFCDDSHAILVQLFVGSGNVDFGIGGADQSFLAVGFGFQNSENSLDAYRHTDARDLNRLYN